MARALTAPQDGDLGLGAGASDPARPPAEDAGSGYRRRLRRLETMPVEFGPPGPELSQGDLFDLVPSVYVHDLGYMSKTDTNKYSLLRNRPESFKLDAEHAATAMAIRRPAIVITHDCEIDKPHSRATLLMASVRPLAKIRKEDREGFRDNTRHRAFYLPE